MATEFPILLPKLTMAAIEGTFVRVVGHRRRSGQRKTIRCTSIETEKVETEVGSSASGVLRHGSVEPGEVYDGRHA